MKAEIIHYVGNKIEVYSHHNRITVTNSTNTQVIKLPWTVQDMFSFPLRILRRFLRTDKMNVYVINEEPLELLIFRQAKVFRYSRKNLEVVLGLKNCRNILHVDLARLPDGRIYFGEYGANVRRKKVPIYCSRDGGRTWNIVYEFPENSIKHVHCVAYDKFSDSLWTFTGDKDGECKILVSNDTFSKFRVIGDGTQTFRACNVFFEKDKAVWLMDSPNDRSYCIHYTRETGVVQKIFQFLGPVWYSTRTIDGIYLCASSVEPGYSRDTNEAILYASYDLLEWKEIVRFRKDIWPIEIFKNGVIAFPIGDMDSRSVKLFGEGLIDLDGKTATINCKDYL